MIRTALASVLLALVTLPTLAADRVLAQGMGGQLTADAADAYFEALAFCLQQIGQPNAMSSERQQGMRELLIQNYATLPGETQQALAAARSTWTQYRNAWNDLTLDQKKGFAFEVLSLAYGEQAAANALGLNTGAGRGGGSGGVSSPGWSDEYSRTYGGATPTGDGTYEVESYDYSTGSYGYSYE